MWRKFSLFFLGAALISFSFSGFLLWQRYVNPNRLSFSTSPVSQGSKFQVFPSRIIIPDLGIDLPVVPAQITNGIWQTTPAGVSYLITSNRPGEVGNSVFYGHNWPNLLGNLKNIQPGQIIQVLSDTSLKTFWVSKVLVVSPDEVALLSPGSHSQLTLYTCYGFADLKRLVVIAYTQNPK